MAYVGGKSKGAQHIVDVLNNKKYDNMNYIEPFIGYAHILRRVKNKKSFIASDANPLVISLLHGIQNNKKYNSMHITKKQYNELKNDTKNLSFKRALAAFAYSYNGKEWGGYTISSGSRDNYPLERKNYYDNLKKNESFMKCSLSVNNYINIKPKNSLIYCDPPYKSTTGYGNMLFDHNKFWDTMRKWSKNNIVYISEYTAPSDFKCVSKREKHQSLNGKGSGKLVYEKLWKFKY